MTRADRVLILVLAVLALASWPLAAAAAGKSAGTVIISGPAGSTTLPLAQDARLQVEGERGPLTVVIAEGAVRVTEADCPDHVCVKTGSVSAAGALVACVPNGVVVRVGGENDELDARVR